MSNDDNSALAISNVSQFAVCTLLCRLEDEDDEVFSEIKIQVSLGEVSIEVSVGTTDMGFENSRRCIVKCEDMEKLIHVCEDENSGPSHVLPIIAAEFSHEHPKPLLVEGMLRIALDGALGFRDWLPVHLKTVMMLATIYGVEGYYRYKEPERTEAKPAPEPKPRKQNAVN